MFDLVNVDSILFEAIDSVCAKSGVPKFLSSLFEGTLVTI
jgi:hypothetical protein